MTLNNKMSFLNIFSKKQKKIKKPKIIADIREKNSLIISELYKQKFEIEFRNLPVADYIINSTAVERKTLSDLKSSIINKRIISQLLEIKQYPSYLLLIEGFSYHGLYASSLHENALRGFLLSVILKYNIPIIFTKNEKDTVKYFLVLSKKTKKTELSFRASKIKKTKKEQIKFILEGFPNIGPKKASLLIEKFKSIKNIMNASPKELKDILGSRTEEFISLIS